MNEARYSIREMPDGTWAVIDKVTEQVAELGGNVQTGFEQWQANYTAGLLNHLYAEGHSVLLQ
ncbi:hypothetical protein DEA98_22365 [Brucella pseudogrignonensis]|jgi:hypothetical protein|uniref:Uncharacterized protein n=2 Tax=Brucella TaxID=234 RepID=A0A656Z4K7_BRUAN|nr:hypothetical protein [Brucella pseudogrignonensis]EMG52650.1 hypothetical protein WYI_16070 [Ochrobactrum sp. CDB2]KYB45627.1 hypothetical protein AB664_06250 [Brucella anthropi]MCM0752863.1 hypothetical protein [Brucella pseudogrignonensis]NNV19434.1 hypothetical protein [Brucella pseudogrignonensis]